MGNLIPESLVWLDQIENLKGKTRKEWRAELKKVHDLSSSQITNLIAVKTCFGQTAFDKVRQAEKANPSFILSLNSAMALAGFKKRVADLSGALHAALDITLARRLTTKQIKKLVKWIISGKPASEFDPNAKEDKGVEKADEDQTGKASRLDLNKLLGLVNQAIAEEAQGKGTVALKKLEKYLRSLNSSSLPDTPQNTSGSKKSFTETILLDWLADIKIIQKIKSKLKKGQDITKGEVAFLWLHKGGEILGHLAKFILKLFKPLLKLLHWFWKQVEEALKVLGLYKYIKAIFTLVVLVAVIWFTCEALHYGVLRPIELAWSKIPWGLLKHEEPVTPDVSSTGITAASPTVSSSELKPKTTNSSLPTSNTPSHPAPVVSYQPSIPFQPSVEDPKLLQFEIEAIREKGYVRDFSVTPDHGIPPDVAVSRIGDLTNPDKYTMMIGKDKQVVSLVNANTTGLTISYKSTDPFGVLTGGSGPVNYLWEDMKAIHVSEIDVETDSPVTVYQISAIAEGAKIPLTFQCATTANLQHLVSALEYFIRNSRLAHDAQPGGLPYPYQGLVLTNDGVVEKLWAGSLMDKAGVQLGNHFWSIGTITSEKQGKDDLEAGLRSLPVTFFETSASEWNRAMLARNPSQANSFRPKLRKIVLNGL
jgi:hypothetical protein